MEERKTIFSYIAQSFTTYGITVLLLSIIVLAFGKGEQEYSNMFALENTGLSIPLLYQFLAVSFISTFFRFLFGTDIVIKHMGIALRTACMLSSILVLIAGFIYLFKWFPVDEWTAWILFLICFILSAGVSTLIAYLNEKASNKRMEEALQKAKDRKI